MITRDQYLTGLERMVTSTEVLFSLVPADKTEWAPKEGMLTCGQLMIHMAGGLAFYAEGITKGVWASTSIDEILKKNHETPHANSALATRILKRSHQSLKAALGTMTDADMEMKIFAPQYKGEVARAQIVIMCMEHLLNHKTELYMYLQILGIPVRSHELYFGRVS